MNFTLYCYLNSKTLNRSQPCFCYNTASTKASVCCCFFTDGWL